MPGIKRCRIECDDMVSLEWSKFKEPIVFDTSSNQINFCAVVKKGRALIGIIPRGAESANMTYSAASAPNHGYFVNVADSNLGERLTLFGQDGTCKKDAHLGNFNLRLLGKRDRLGVWLRYRNAASSKLMARFSHDSGSFVNLEFHAPIVKDHYMPCIMLEEGSSIFVFGVGSHGSPLGKYTVTQAAAVTEEANPSSRIVGEFQRGAIANVVEVVQYVVGGRIRVRVDDPPGYMSIFRIADDMCWLQKLDDATREREPNTIQHAQAAFSRLWEDKRFTDAQLICEGRCFDVHRNIVALSSPVLAAAFSSGMVEDADRKVDIKDASSQGLQELLRFVYTGDFDEGKADLVLPLAIRYQVSALAKECATILLDDLTADNVTQLLPIIRAYRSDGALPDIWDEVVRRVRADERLVRKVLE